MKEYSRVSRLMLTFFCVIIGLPLTGCALGGTGNWHNNPVQAQQDIYILSKVATRISLKESKTPSGDVVIVEGYLTALKDLLAVPGHPNFNGARSLVGVNLPPKYKVYGFTIIDLIERYLNTAELNVTEDQEIIINLISAGIDGALDAVKELKTG